MKLIATNATSYSLINKINLILFFIIKVKDVRDYFNFCTAFIDACLTKFTVNKTGFKKQQQQTPLIETGIINMILTNRDNIPSQMLHVSILNLILFNITNNIEKTIKLLINFAHGTQTNGVINNENMSQSNLDHLMSLAQ